MFWFIQRKKWFYDPDRCEKIISNFTGPREVQVLRALADGKLRPCDIKNYYISGNTHFAYDREIYKLINIISRNDYDRKEYKFRRHESGSNHSILQENELLITAGVATIIEHWAVA